MSLLRLALHNEKHWGTSAPIYIPATATWLHRCLSAKAPFSLLTLLTVPLVTVTGLTEHDTFVSLHVLIPNRHRSTNFTTGVLPGVK